MRPVLLRLQRSAGRRFGLPRVRGREVARDTASAEEAARSAGYSLLG
jgi:hypothetical protein